LTQGGERREDVFNMRNCCNTNWIQFLPNINKAMTTILCAAGDESFDASNVGEAAEVVQEVVCDDELILIKG
jgi:hypothetical protein